MNNFRGNPNYFPGIRNNNPGNLRPGHDWQGMAGEDKLNFIIFESMEYGIRALTMDITNKYLRGLKSIYKMISVYAPPSENDTQSYCKAISRALNIYVFEDIELTYEVVKTLVRAVIDHENGKQAHLVTEEMIIEGMSLIPDTMKKKIAGFPAT